MSDKFHSPKTRACIRLLRNIGAIKAEEQQSLDCALALQMPSLHLRGQANLHFSLLLSSVPRFCARKEKSAAA
jgi:hypothetical protein